MKVLTHEFARNTKVTYRLEFERFHLNILVYVQSIFTLISLKHEFKFQLQSIRHKSAFPNCIFAFI